VVGEAVATPPPDLDDVARLEKDTSANLEGATLAGNTSTPAELEGSTQAGQSTSPPPADPNVTLLDEATSASGIASGWAVPATAGGTGVYAAENFRPSSRS